MAEASTSVDMSPGLLRVAERARREPEGRFHSLAHLIDVPALRRAYARSRKDAAVGVDGMTKERYGQDLDVLPPPADPTHPHPEGTGQDAADWDIGVRGQIGPGRRPRGFGVDLRAGLLGLFVRIPASA
jgi:hypothetical protein